MSASIGQSPDATHKELRDCEWLADLLRHGLLHPSFIPEAPIRDLRELTRYRRSLVQDRTAVANRVHKLIESANIRLAQVLSEVMDVSGRRLLRAIAEGRTDIRSGIHHWGERCVRTA